MVVIAVLALIVSAATPDRRLADLEALVGTMQKELIMVKMQQIDSTSLHEKGLTADELKSSLFSEKQLKEIEE